MRISDWSSDVCSSDLRRRAGFWARARRRRFPVFPTMMRNLAIRAQEGEQMDSPDLPEPVYREVLGGLRRINAATLANRPTLDFLSRAERRDRPFRLLDVGFGECSEGRRVGQEGVSTCRS